MRKHLKSATLIWLMCAAAMLISGLYPDSAFAATNYITDVGFSNDTIGGPVWDFGETLDGLSFKRELMGIVGAIYTASRSALIIMTAVAGFMVVFGQENGQKLIFSYILGVGLALNFAGFMFGLYENYLLPTSAASMPSLPEELHKLSGVNKDYLSKFMAYYISVVTYGQTRIVPVAIRMALIFGTLQASWKMATEIGSGNQIKYVVTEVMKMSFIIFLIMNWIQLGHAMGEWFEAIGFLAGGIDPSMKDAPNIKPDSIWNNAMSFSGKMWENVEKASGIANTIMAFVVFLFIVVVLFLTAIEVFMCRIEFYTLTLLGIVLLPFFLVDKLNFLGTNTINGMFKISAKVMVISFLQAVTFTILNAQLKEFYEGPAAKSSFAFGAYVELGMTCLVMYVLVKQIPNLVSSFLSGSGGGLGGGSMLGQLGAVGAAAGGAAMTGLKVAGTAVPAVSAGLQAYQTAMSAAGKMSEMAGAGGSAGGGGGMMAAAMKKGGAALSGLKTAAGVAGKSAVGAAVGQSKAMQNLMTGVGLGKEARTRSIGSMAVGNFDTDRWKQKGYDYDTAPPPPFPPPPPGGGGSTAQSADSKASNHSNSYKPL